ncbi:MAG: CpsB/CapC family capsule biosynthesis tyrosine phosphatase [Chitinophagaceae bacterium]
MFGLFSKKTTKGEKFRFEDIGTDMHSHILPGIDDGSPDLETSLNLIRGLQELGYSRLIATPHILWDMFRNTPEIIKEKLDLVREAVLKAGIDIRIDAAAEYYLDEHVSELLAKKEPLLTIGDKKVLIEFSMAFPPFNVKETLFELQMQGYQPVFVHPERYSYLQRNREFFDEMKEIGCIFQLNILSLSGQYGKGVTELSHYLLKKDYYDLLGTDLHHSNHLAMLKQFHNGLFPADFNHNSRFLNKEL